MAETKLKVGAPITVESIDEIVKEAIKSGDRATARQGMSILRLVVNFLGFGLLLGVAGWVAMVFADKTIPGELGVIIGAIAGGLVGVIANPNS